MQGEGFVVEAKVSPGSSLIDAKYGERLRELLQNVPEGVTIETFIDTYFKAYQEELPYKLVESCMCAVLFDFECSFTDFIGIPLFRSIYF